MTNQVSPRVRRIRSSCLQIAVVGLLMLAGLVAALVIYTRRHALPRLDRQRFDAARSQWERNGVPDYDIGIEVEGRQPARYQVSVRNGLAQRALRNGNPLTQPRTWGTWSVPGMFGTMQSDVENVERVARRAAAESTPRLVLRAQFDPHWGYPAEYHRLQLDNSYEVRWRVIQFRPLEDNLGPGAAARK